MKNARKLTSILLLIAMLFMIAAPAMAEGEGGNQAEKGTITISNAVVGQTYTIYRIFDLESYSGATEEKDENGQPTGNKTGGNYAYKVNNAWAPFFAKAEGNTPAGEGLNYVTINDQGYVSWKEGANAESFAKAAQEYAASQSGFANQGKTTATAPTGNPEATTTTVEFNNLDLGYYLMDSTLGVLCSLDTTNPNVKIKEKNTQPTIEKKVQEDSKIGMTDEWGDTNDADINQVVNFKTTVHAKKGAQNYVVHDKMDSILEFDSSSVKIMVGENELTAKSDKVVMSYDKETKQGYQYEVICPGTEKETPCSFHIVFVQEYLDTITEDTDIIIEYKAKLTSSAKVGTDYENKTQLEYGDKNFTAWDTTKTRTWDVDIFKYAMIKAEGATEETKTGLAGAKFSLSKNEKGTEKIYLIAEENNTYRVAKVDKDGKAIEENNTDEIVTDTSGKFTIRGLDADTYYLIENEAPAGYNKLSQAITVVIDNAGKTKVYNEGNEEKELIEVGSVEVENQSGTELPSTGGIGTTIFYVVGAALVVGAGVLLVTKKRMTGQR